jgi:MFS family permease
VDKDNINSLDNWVETLDLMCVPDSKIEFMSNWYYLGEIVGGVLITRIPDVYGRKWPLAISTSLQLPIMIATIFSRSYTLTCIFGFIMGILHMGIYNGCYINVCEYVHERWKNKVCSLLLVFDMLTCIIISAYWRYISKNWLWLHIFACCCNAVALIGLYLLPESPEYLYSFYRFHECREVMFQIALFNSSKVQKDSMTMSLAILEPNILPVEYNFDKEAELRQIKFSKNIAERQDNYVQSLKKGDEHRLSIEIQRSVKSGIREFFKERDLVVNLGLSMLLWYLSVMAYQINDYYDSYFPGDYFEYFITISVNEMIAYIIADFVFEGFKTKKSTKLFFYSYSICIVGALTIMINNEKEYPVIDMIGQFICKFGIASGFQACYLANVLFPIIFASTTFGVCVMMNSVAAFCSIFII